MSVAAQHSRYDQPVPHPILDNSSKMMRLIANPVYDKLTKARAAGVRKYSAGSSAHQTGQLHREKETPKFSYSQPVEAEEVTTTTLSNPAASNTGRIRSKSTPKIQSLLPLNLRTSLLQNQSPPRSATPGPRSRASTARSRASTARSRASAVHARAAAARARARAPPDPADLSMEAIQAELIADTAKIPKPIPDHTVRYVNTRHGFEVQYYSSRNWLATEVYTQESLPQNEQTFRDMLERKRLHERLSQNIYSSDYYTHRLSELLLSYKQGILTHAEWAKQNYQLHFLKTLYIQAVKREQQEKQGKEAESSLEQSVSVHNASAEGKDVKIDDNAEQHPARMSTPFSHNNSDEASFVTNTSLLFPTFSNVEDSQAALPNRRRLMSMSTNDDGGGESRRATTAPTTTRPQTARLLSESAIKSKALLLLDEQRWSLQAMVKRVVGLADQLPSHSTVPLERQSSITVNAGDLGKAC